ncbi:hypothetical protein Dalk_0345 [Desulfatibacillum aliphaticivorans]|uniref:Uncharacterized protein n=1 Tax=Desulfatibacillum aliphaticivorans TaxID=218208 RepID=B8F922_DESAL|nr:hypothetical protein [Desulfatibacillum aliphaticivorans]ACL02054.1 hypothetical protein Dalk_0345 [Desulfatibacillum aliphaticivorans]
MLINFYNPHRSPLLGLYQVAFKHVIIFQGESRNDAGSRLAVDPEKRIALAGMTAFCAWRKSGGRLSPFRQDKGASKTFWLLKPPLSVIPVEGGAGMIAFLNHPGALPETGTQCPVERRLDMDKKS